MIDRATYARFATDPAAFRDALIIDRDGQPRRFGDVMDPWQREDFRALDPGLLRCIGRTSEPAKMRAYLERPRGHSKTSDLAITAVYAMAFAVRPIRGFAYASDRDQARLLRDAMATVLRLNPWLGEILEVQAHSVVNVAPQHPGQGGSLSIEASDVGSSYGILPDLIVADELAHWPASGEGLWHSLISSAAKRSNCLLTIISNAGFSTDWQFGVRETARTDADTWIFRRLDGPVASWLTPQRLAEQRKMLPPSAYARLWGNVWQSGGGDALQPADIGAAFRDDLQPMTGDEEGWAFVAGVDLGVSRDHSAVVTLAVPQGRYGRIRLAAHRTWKPTPNKKIDLREVEEYILSLDAQFGLEFIALDPWQGELLAARLESNTAHKRRNSQRRFWAQPWVRAIPPTAANLRAQCSLLVESFQDGRLQFYPCPALRQDLTKLRIVEKSYGIRVESPRDAQGHGDLASAFMLGLQISHEVSLKKRPSVGASCESVSPMLRAVAELDAERDADEAERAEFDGWDAHGLNHAPSEMIQALRRVGRI